MLFNILLFIFVCFAVVMLWVMAYDTSRFVTRTYEIRSSKLHKMTKIVFLSDLHNKSYGKDNERLLAEIDAISPDAVLLGGDMMNAIPKAKFEHAVHLIQSLCRKYPVYYAMGNHEYRARIYPETYGDLYDRYLEKLKDLPLIRLDNETCRLTDDISLSGVTIDRYYYKRFVKRQMEEGYLASVLEKQGDENRFRVLLAHNPEYFHDYAKWGADLVLSGHVHGGVARIPGIGGVIAPSLKPFPHYDGGFFSEFGSKMILSRGLGEHTIPVRLFNPGELVCVQFGPED